MSIHRLIRTLFAIAFSFIISSCIPIKDSPAPGCIKYIGFSPMGGCSGKTVILDLTLEGGAGCLSVDVNNCNGGILKITNACSEVLVLQNIEIPPSDSANLDLRQTTLGALELVLVSSNFSAYIPETDRSIQISGSLGNHSVVITLTKTAPLCE